MASSSLKSTNLFGSNTASAALRRAYETDSSDAIGNEYKRVVRRNLGTSSQLQAAILGTAVPAIPSTPVLATGGNTTLDKLDLAQQLRVVLQLVAANVTLGMKRQVFMVSVPGFDTHSNQTTNQPIHMSQVANAIDYFESTLVSLGLHSQVTLFTASDFGRTLLSNGDGSDHGWGNHHFVVGGAVRGGNILGNFPETALGSNTDVGSGRLLPTTSVTELAAALSGWMGLSPTEQRLVLPNLGSFSPTLAAML